MAFLPTSFILYLPLFQLSLFSLVLAQSDTVALYPTDPSFFPGATQDCLNAYSANVSCTPVIQNLYYSLFAEYDTSDLDALCTSDCYSSLVQHRRNVSQSCVDAEIYDDYLSINYAPTTWDDQALYAYNMTCLKKSGSNQYCAEWFESTANSTVTGDCDSCNLASLQMQLNSPFEGQDPVLASLFDNLTSSCSSTQYTTATTTASYVINITAPVYQRVCASNYSVQHGDTAFSVSAARNVSTSDLLTINGMNSNSTFPQSGSLCIPRPCAVYVVKANDTCSNVASTAGISTVQLMSWNVNIGLCLDLTPFEGQSLCVSNPAGNFASPSTTANATGVFTTEAPVPTNVVSGTNTDCGEYYSVVAGDDCGTITEKFGITLKDFLFLNPEVNGNCSNLFRDYSYCVAPVGTITTYSGYASSTTTSTSFAAASSTALPWTDPIWTDNSTLGNSTQVFVPLASDTRTDCWTYVFINASTPVLEDCRMFAVGFGIAYNDLINWNPSLAAEMASNSTTNSTASSCTVSTSMSYCVQLASPTPPPPQDTSLPSPLGADTAENCTRYQLAPQNFPCSSLYAIYDLSLEQFFALNPSVKDDCSGFVAGTYYCVSIDPSGFNGPDPSSNATSTATTTSSGPATTTSSTSGGIVTPTPTQSGMVSDCTKFYDVKSGDGCYDIAQNNSITLDDFYAWNPAVGDDCSSLWPDYYVCVGVQATTSTLSTSATPTPTSSSSTPTTTSSSAVATPTPTRSGMVSGCTKFYEAVSGDTCSGIAQNYDISLSTFVDWNPDVESDCSGLWANYYYCVGGPSTD